VIDEEGTMGARTPEQIDELMLAAYAAKDAEAVADLYEDDAIFSNPPDGWTVVGRAAIIEKLNEMFSMTSSISWVDTPMKAVVDGDYAFFHATNVGRAVLADGTQHEAPARTTTIAHRGTDGNWRFVIDHSSTP
jgi:uncharacterized protein (TIGR02246 family)